MFCLVSVHTLKELDPPSTIFTAPENMVSYNMTFHVYRVLKKLSTLLAQPHGTKISTFFSINPPPGPQSVAPFKVRNQKQQIFNIRADLGWVWEGLVHDVQKILTTRLRGQISGDVDEIQLAGRNQK